MRGSSVCQCELLPRAKHQYLTEFVVFCVTMSGVAFAEDFMLQFLKGVPRFNSSTGYTDYYICCKAQGSFLGWQVGTDRLTGFSTNDAGRVIVDTRPAYEYTATLLSSRPLPASNHHQMDSVIVVTFIGMSPSSFEVTCTGKTNTSTIQVVGNTSVVENTNSSDHNEVVLDYILTSKIVQNKNFTHIFVCGTSDVQQQYKLETSRIGFSSQDRIGQVRLVLSEDGYTVTILGVLVSRHPYTLTSILFVSEDSIVNVRCFDQHHQVELPSNSATTPMPRVSTSDASTLYLPMNPMSTSPPKPPVLSSSSLETTLLMLDNAVDMTSSRPSHTLSTDIILNNANVNAIVVPVVSFITSLLFILIVYILIVCIWCCKCRSRSPRLSPCSPKKHQKAIIAQENEFSETCKGEIVTESRTRRNICCSILRKVESTPNDKGDGDINCGMETSIDALVIKPMDFIQTNEGDLMWGNFLEDQDCTEKLDEFSTVAESSRDSDSQEKSSSPNNSPKNKDPSKKIDSEESYSEGYSSGVWSASEDGFSDDELLRKLMESWASHRQEQCNCLHHFVWTHSRSYTYDNLVFIRDSKSPYSKTAETSIVVDGHTKEIQDAVNDVVFIKPSKIPRVYSRQAISFSIAGLNQEFQDSSRSAEAESNHCEDTEQNNMDTDIKKKATSPVIELIEQKKAMEHISGDADQPTVEIDGIDKPSQHADMSDNVAKQPDEQIGVAKREWEIPLPSSYHACQDFPDEQPAKQAAETTSITGQYLSPSNMVGDEVSAKPYLTHEISELSYEDYITMLIPCHGQSDTASSVCSTRVETNSLIQPHGLCNTNGIKISFIFLAFYEWWDKLQNGLEGFPNLEIIIWHLLAAY